MVVEITPLIQGRIDDCKREPETDVAWFMLIAEIETQARFQLLQECFWCAESPDDPVHGKVTAVEREGSDGLGNYLDYAHSYLPLSEGARTVKPILENVLRMYPYVRH